VRKPRCLQPSGAHAGQSPHIPPVHHLPAGFIVTCGGLIVPFVVLVSVIVGTIILFSLIIGAIFCSAVFGFAFFVAVFAILTFFTFIGGFGGCGFLIGSQKPVAEVGVVLGGVKDNAKCERRNRHENDDPRDDFACRALFCTMDAFRAACGGGKVEFVLGVWVVLTCAHGH